MGKMYIASLKKAMTSTERARFSTLQRMQSKHFDKLQKLRALRRTKAHRVYAQRAIEREYTRFTQYSTELSKLQRTAEKKAKVLGLKWI